jgi:hypothetical protein
MIPEFISKEVDFRIPQAASRVRAAPGQAVIAARVEPIEDELSMRDILLEQE